MLRTPQWRRHGGGCLAVGEGGQGRWRRGVLLHVRRGGRAGATCARSGRWSGTGR